MGKSKSSTQVRKVIAMRNGMRTVLKLKRCRAQMRRLRIHQAHQAKCHVNKRDLSSLQNRSPKTTYKVSQPGDHDFKKIETPFFDENPLPNLKRFHMPDQSLFTKKINPLPPLEDLDGWHGPVLERTRTVPKKCFGKLEISCQSKPSNNNYFNSASKEMDSMTGQGWISIPIQRL